MTTIKRGVAVPMPAPVLERSAVAALALLAATFAFESIRPLLRLGSLVLTNVEAVLFLAVGLWLAACVVARRRPHLPRTVALPAVVWLAVLLLSSLLASSHRMETIKFTARMASGVLVAWAAYDLSQIESRWQILVHALALGGLAAGLFGLAEAVGLPGVDRFLAAFKEGHTVVGETLRVSSTLAYATIASMVLELSVPLLLAWVLTARRRRSQALLGAGLVAALAAQALTLTRGGLLALLAALGCMAAWAAWRRGRIVLVGSLAAAAILLALWGALLAWNPVTRYRLVSETPALWYQAAYGAPSRLTVAAGEIVRVPVTVTNTSVRTWQAAGSNRFQLSYHLARPTGANVKFDGARSPLPHDLPAGADARVEAALSAPVVAGEYVVEWDMLQEDVTWFSWEGTAPAQTLLTVVGTAPAGAAPQQLPDLAPRPEVAIMPEEQGRLWLWQVAAEMFAERPLLGIGPDNFRWLHAAHAGAEQGDTRVHANNLYIEWLVDTGVVGFAAFLWLAWRLVRAAYGRLAKHVVAGSRGVWQVALIASLVAWFVHGALDFFYEFTPTYVAFALICGLALSGKPLSEQGERPCASDSI